MDYRECAELLGLNLVLGDLPVTAEWLKSLGAEQQDSSNWSFFVDGDEVLGVELEYDCESGLYDVTAFVDGYNRWPREVSNQRQVLLLLAALLAGVKA